MSDGPSLPPDPLRAPRADQPTRRSSGDVVVAAPGFARRALERIAGSGKLGVGISMVEMDQDGRPLPGGAQDAEVLWRHGRVTREWGTRALTSLPGLQWAHSDFVGVDGLPLGDLDRRGVLLTNGVGNYSWPMAEWTILAMLSAVKNFPTVVRNSDAGVWELPGTLGELRGKVALLLGLGSVNSLVAPLAAALGVEVRASARQRRDSLPQGVSTMHLADTWRCDLPEVDFLILGLPQTPETERIVNADVLGRLKPGAWLINLARGGLVDEDALVEAVDSGQVGGAVLDAFTEEPLPPSHPLWRRPNVTIVPHHTWSSERVNKRIEDLFADQLLRWVTGEPLANVVDFAVGY